MRKNLALLFSAAVALFLQLAAGVAYAAPAVRVDVNAPELPVVTAALDASSYREPSLLAIPGGAGTLACGRFEVEQSMAVESLHELLDKYAPSAIEWTLVPIFGGQSNADAVAA